MSCHSALNVMIIFPLTQLTTPTPYATLILKVNVMNSSRAFARLHGLLLGDLFAD